MAALVLGRVDLPVGAPALVLWDVVTGIEAGREVLPDVRFTVVAGRAFEVGYEWTETFDDGRVEHVRVTAVTPPTSYTVLAVRPDGRTASGGTRVLVADDRTAGGSVLRFEAVVAVPAALAVLAAPFAWLTRMLAGDRGARRAFLPTMQRVGEAARRLDQS